MIGTGSDPAWLGGRRHHRRTKRRRLFAEDDPLLEYLHHKKLREWRLFAIACFAFVSVVLAYLVLT